MSNALRAGRHGRSSALRRSSVARRALVTLELVTGAAGLAGLDRVGAAGGGVRGCRRDRLGARLAPAQDGAMTGSSVRPRPARSAKPGGWAVAASDPFARGGRDGGRGHRLGAALVSPGG